MQVVSQDVVEQQVDKQLDARAQLAQLRQQAKRLQKRCEPKKKRQQQIAVIPNSASMRFTFAHLYPPPVRLFHTGPLEHGQHQQCQVPGGTREGQSHPAREAAAPGICKVHDCIIFFRGHSKHPS